MIFSLLQWYDQHARPLPWRESPPVPYHVLLSEIMLQQTRIEAVKEHYHRFLVTCPDIASLANLPDDQLMKLWEGLGYYSRARNLKKAALILAQDGFPQTAEQLEKLPGVGPYTAAAIASIAFDVPAAAVDGNVLRVLSRLHAQNFTRESATQWLLPKVPQGKAGAFTQAWMELGEVVCLPNGTPLCSECPLHKFCVACKQNCIAQYPAPAAKPVRTVQERTLFLLRCKGRIALHKRPSTGLLANLWEFPAIEKALSPKETKNAFPDLRNLTSLGSAKHLFTHIEWRMKLYSAELEEPLPQFLWESPQTILRNYAIPSAFKKLKDCIQE